jgi:Domain of Unknown Function with PDB structure (DUF3857)
VARLLGRFNVCKDRPRCDESRPYELCVALLIFLLAGLCDAVPVERFQPLKDTLTQYGILKIPEPSDYPDVPAIALLSITEYRQMGSRHTRSYHKVLKILTSQGKEYTKIRIPCFTTCHIEARTIKTSGKIVNLPSKDLYRNQNLSGYQSPFFFAQFAMPGVETGDVIEYKATIEYPVPFFLEDFRFQEPYPVIKGVFFLTHPSQDSYTYVRYSPPGSPGVLVSQSQFLEGPVRWSRTTFVVENVKDAPDIPYSPKSRQDLPGMRLMIEVRSERRFEVFRDWYKYGEFVLRQTSSPQYNGTDVLKFAQDVAGNSEDIKEIIRRIYGTAEKSIQITEDSLLSAGFEFRQPDKVLKEKVAAPHDFALFLAACFRLKRWSSDLVLVNSHERPDASKDSVFPPDLDLVFLNVKTPIGEFLLDCNQNGLPAFHISSSAMNRFALGIPLFTVTSQFTRAGVYTSTMPFREGNVSRMEIVAAPEENRWKLDFHWTLGGEFQSSWVKIFRLKGETELKKQLIQELRSHSEAFDFHEVTYQFTVNGMEIRAKAYRVRNPLQEKLEMLQNDFWDAGFDLRPHLLEQRVNRLLLPVVGEISSVLKIDLSGETSTVPDPITVDCPPVRYSVSFVEQNHELRIEEKFLIQDMGIRPSVFPKFSDFLNQYYKNHYWSVLLAS